jgi:hypothetical protein
MMVVLILYSNWFIKLKHRILFGAKNSGWKYFLPPAGPIKVLVLAVILEHDD